MRETNKWFLKFKSNPGSKIRLFCFHHSGGGASTYYRWLDHLSTEIELIAIQLPGRENRFSEPLATNIEDIIVNLSEGFSLYKDKPYIIFGHSLGALIGFEFVKAIIHLYSMLPSQIIVSAARAPHLTYRRKSLSQLDNESLTQELKGYNGIDMNILNNNDLLSIFLPIIRKDFSLLEGYQYVRSEPFSCNMLALAGSHDKTVQTEEIRAWSEHTTGKFEYLSFAGEHFFLKDYRKGVLEVINKIGEQHIKNYNIS